jgi:hypothetical protein
MQSFIGKILFIQILLAGSYLKIFSQEIQLTIPLSSHCTIEDIQRFDSITTYYTGIAGTGFTTNTEFIGKCPAKYQWGGPWKPIDGYKHTLCGKIYFKKRKSIFHSNEKSKYHFISDGDGDMSFYVFPDTAFSDLLLKSLRPQGHVFKDLTVGCETGVKESGKSVETNIAQFIERLSLASLQNTAVGVYGPWVSDMHHDNSPEIHPVQQMWRFENKTDSTIYQLFSFYDNSSRFNDKADYAMDCFKKEWIPTPLLNTFYIPFEINTDTNDELLFESTVPSYNNINTYEEKENLSIIIAGKKRLSFVKSMNNFPDVKLYGLCQVNSNTIHGYLKIETSIGKKSSNNGGHAVIYVTKQIKN